MSVDVPLSMVISSASFRTTPLSEIGKSKSLGNEDGIQYPGKMDETN
ncbi:hypothetical protein P7D01_28890 [Bacillus paranthracis]|nr:hypothetical protein [Bacillus paranthracis]